MGSFGRIFPAPVGFVTGVFSEVGGFVRHVFPATGGFGRYVFVAIGGFVVRHVFDGVNRWVLLGATEPGIASASQLTTDDGLLTTGNADPTTDDGPLTTDNAEPTTDNGPLTTNEVALGEA